MRSSKQMIAAICLLCAFLQAPAAHAQFAQLLGALASGVAPMAIPMTIMGTISAVRAIPQIPQIIKDNLPAKPRWWPRKSGAAADNSQTPPTEQQTIEAATSVSGQVKEITESQPPKAPQEISEKGERAEIEQIAAPARRATTDNSEWYLEDDTRSRALPVRISERPAESEQQPAAKPKPVRATKSVQAQKLDAPAEASTSNSSTTAAAEAPKKEARETEAAPVIMMKMSE